MKSGLTWGSFLCIICLFGVVPGAQVAADGHVFVAAVGVVNRRGTGPSPWVDIFSRSISKIEIWDLPVLMVYQL